MSTVITNLIFLAMVIEGIIEGISSTITFSAKYSELIKRAMSVILGLSLAFGFNIDYSNVLGFAPAYEWVGLVFTGIVAGLGSSVIHSIFNYVR